MVACWVTVPLALNLLQNCGYIAYYDWYKKQLPTKVALILQVLVDNLIERMQMNLGKLQSLKGMTLYGNWIASLPDECNSFLQINNIFFACAMYLMKLIFTSL